MIFPMISITKIVCVMIEIEYTNSGECMCGKQFGSKLENVFVDSELSSVYYGHAHHHPFW